MELLVVIAIIAVLASMLMPSLRSAREAAKRSLCASNLKQLGVAMQAYFAENGAVIPPTYYGATLTTLLFVGKRSVGFTWDTNDPRRFLNPYVNAPNSASGEVLVARCPVDKGYPAAGYKSTYTQAGTSYIINYVRPDTLRTLGSNQGQVFPASRITNPARTILFTDHAAFNYATVGGVPGDRRQFWHTSNAIWVNMCYVDGHVQYVRLAVPGEAGYPDTADYTWSP